MSGKPRVLVVEDQPHNRELVAQLLEDDYDVSFANDGDAALSAIGQGWAAVLLDIDLPKVDGLDVVRRARGQLGLSALPIIAVTAHAMIGDRERFLAAGFDEHVTKPIDEKLLFDALRRFIPGGQVK